MGVCPVLLVEPAPAARDRALASLGRAGSPLLAHALSPGLLEEVAPDVVVIASPSGLHFAHAAAALACRLRTYVEKPLACTARQAHLLARLGDRRLAVSEQRVHRADLRLVRRVIRSGLVGPVRRITYRDTVAPVPSFTTSWRNDPRLAGGGVLLDLGYHTLGTLLWLLEGVAGELVVQFARLRQGGLCVEEGAEVRCSHGDIEIVLHLAFSDRRGHEMLRVQGARAEVTVVRDRAGASSVVTLSGDRDRTRTSVALDGSHDTRSLRDFVAGRVQSGHISRHIQTVELLEHIYQRAEGG
jgi:predicted dehydrogenase